MKFSWFKCFLKRATKEEDSNDTSCPKVKEVKAKSDLRKTEHGKKKRKKKKNVKARNAARMKFYLKNADIILQTDGSSRDFADSIQVHGVGGVILLPKTREGRGIWGGCFRQFCGHLGNIDNAEYEGVAIGLEVVVKMVERGVVGDGSKFTFYIRTDNAKIYLYLKDKANRKDRNCDDVAKDIKKRVDYLVDRLEALGGEIHCERIDRAFNRFAKKLANDGAQMEVRDKSGKKAIPGNLTSWNELEVPVRAGLGRLFQEDFPTGLDLEVKFPM